MTHAKIYNVNEPCVPQQVKKCLRTSAKSADSDNPAHAQIIILAIVLHSYILKYPWILLADNEDPDQTARMAGWSGISLSTYAYKTHFACCGPCNVGHGQNIMSQGPVVQS